MTATNIHEKINEALNDCLVETHFNFGARYQGKVRDQYMLPDKLILITTDRLSAFDRHLANIPYKGQVLNLISAWWFEHTAHLVPNHLLSVPDPNVMLVKKCDVFPIEFVVRKFITGTTNTSLWTQYQNGRRDFDDLHLPEDLKKNAPLPQLIITPTTKEKDHDRPISADEIIARGLMTQAEWQQVKKYALTLFQFAMMKMQAADLLLVDTKYEFGKDAEGKILLIDELHTPDSSRYWRASSYQARFNKGEEPENIDKEFFRLWFAQHCNPYQDENLPAAPDALIVTLAERYIQLYEMITGNRFPFPKTNEDKLLRIKRNLAGYM